MQLDMPKSSARVLGVAGRVTRDRPWVHPVPWYHDLQMPINE